MRHGCYVVFQLAEVAVPRALFTEVLRRIDQLRPNPPPLAELRQEPSQRAPVSSLCPPRGSHEMTNQARKKQKRRPGESSSLPSGERAVIAGRGVAHSNSESIPPDLIQIELERIIASSAFDVSRRNRAFLRFIVEETLAGRGDRIKAYTIATSVLQRDETFDPQADPIVRIEASRLRRSLERYYLIAGQADPVRIDVPKWGYVPSFRRLRPPGGEGVFARGPAEEPPVLPQPAARAQRRVP